MAKIMMKATKTKVKSETKLPKKKKTWSAPEGFTKTIVLSSTNKAEIKVAHFLDTIDVKAKIVVFGRYYRGPDDTGPIVKHIAKVKVPSTHVIVKLENGHVLQARSCCKPPDVFNRYEGIIRAARRLVREDAENGRKLSKKDRRTVMEALCPGLFRKVKANDTVKLAAAPRKV